MSGLGVSQVDGYGSALGEEGMGWDEGYKKSTLLETRVHGGEGDKKLNFYITL